jgi:hypothetical protein
VSKDQTAAQIGLAGALATVSVWLGCRVLPRHKAGEAVRFRGDRRG